MTQHRANTQDSLSRTVVPHALPMPSSGVAPWAGEPLLGRYRIVEEIGGGGMATVHLARVDGPGGFQKWVAIKRIHPHLVADESFVQMFFDEARIAARISHPNVATVFDLGRQGNTYWIAMEYLHGEPLREIMRRAKEAGGAMPAEIAARVIADAAEGLHSAHELRGDNGEKLHVIHRDVTPHNLFVTYDGVTKVVDFGIAKCRSRISSTRAGTLKGKLAYMSPEQAHGEAIDRRTDVFALGVVLWELTTGRRLFRVDSELGTLAKVRECDIPRPSAIVRAYPIDLENIVMKALAKNRMERFATAREFSRALQSLLMRRGLFVASEEVAGYVQFIFRDRIRARESDLRSAGKLPPRDLASSSTPSLHTYVSDVHAGAIRVRGAPRPAAGTPAMSRPTSRPADAVREAAQRRTTTAHADAVGFGHDFGDESDTLVTRRVMDERISPSSLPPNARPRQRKPWPRTVARRAAAPLRMPVWAAAALSGALALVPAAGIFVALSRALRSSATVVARTTPVSTALPVPVSSTALRHETDAGRPPAVETPTSVMEDFGDCRVSPCAP